MKIKPMQDFERLLHDGRTVQFTLEAGLNQEPVIEVREVANEGLLLTIGTDEADEMEQQGLDPTNEDHLFKYTLTKLYENH